MPTREDIRPPEILEKTTFYLIDNIFVNENNNWLFAYDFVLDRLKAVRQDLVMQSLWGETSCNILQCAVRFHLYSAYRGCEDKSNQFDPHLNYSNLHECLTRLVVLRSNLNEQDSFERAEAEAVYLIHNLGSAEVLRRAVGLQNKILCHELVKMAVDLNMAWMKRNFIRVMRIVKRLPFMLLCALLPHVEEIRRSTLAIMSSAYSCKNMTFPMGQLSTILLCDVGECKDLCKYYGIMISGDGTSAVFRKEQFLGTKLPPSSHQYKFMKQRHGDADLRKLLRGLY